MNANDYKLVIMVACAIAIVFGLYMWHNMRDKNATHSHQVVKYYFLDRIDLSMPIHIDSGNLGTLELNPGCDDYERIVDTLSFHYRYTDGPGRKIENMMVNWEPCVIMQHNSILCEAYAAGTLLVIHREDGTKSHAQSIDFDLDSLKSMLQRKLDTP